MNVVETVNSGCAAQLVASPLVHATSVTCRVVYPMGVAGVDVVVVEPVEEVVVVTHVGGVVLVSSIAGDVQVYSDPSLAPVDESLSTVALG